MIRTHCRYDVELLIRDIDGGTAYGTVRRFLYVDGEEQHWVRVLKDWYPVDDPYKACSAFVAELPDDLEVEDVQEFFSEREAA